MTDPSASKPKLSFGFKLAAKARLPQPPAGPKLNAFGDTGQDDDQDQDGTGELHSKSAASTSAAASNSARSKPKRLDGNLALMGLAPGKSATPASRSDRKKQQEAEQLDASVFDYDNVYDSIKDAERKVKQAKQEQSSERKPKYIGNFLESAELRKRDRQRAEAKMLQREREAEGDEFADKEAFVTAAYKEQQDDIAKAEEEERRKEEEDRKKSKGMGTFYRDMLDETSAAREAAIAASLQPQASSSKEEEAASQHADPSANRKNDAELADEARKRGVEVELNDENQIVDKRDLLSKGLNVVSRRRQAEPQTAQAEQQERESRQERDQRRREEYENRMNRDAQRSRQSALIEEQMLELERKRKREEEDERQREKEKANTKRNDESAISSARQRYLERKKKKAEQPAEVSPG